ncbi:MAG TPA: glycosyltransferase [bacterium]|jgi:rhamnosyl/mannosyltransferase|nr:glycosyltransferase [bacterium]HOG38030.1 glycosyltransferase [bacterium]
MQKLNITHITCAFPPYRSGIGNACMSQAKMGNVFNYEIVVITPKYKKLEAELEEIIDNVKIKRIKPVFEFGNAGYINTYKYIKNSDIIHLHFPFYGTALFVVLFAKILKKKIVVFWHMIPEAKGIKQFIFKIYEKIITPIIFKNSNKILVSTFDYFKSYSPKLFNKFQSKIINFPFGVNLDEFEIQEKNLEIINQHNLHNKKILLFVGGLDTPHYFKGLEILIKALKELNDDYRLLVIGSGDMREYYEKLSKQLKVENKIVFVGNASNQILKKYYSTCDCFVFPSLTRSEAFGIVQIEAMASGKPVIYSNLPGVREVPIDGKTGFSFTTGDYLDLKQKIEKLFSSNLLEFSKNARHRVEENFNEHKLTKKLNSIYENLYN